MILQAMTGDQTGADSENCRISPVSGREAIERIWLKGK